MKRQGFRRRTMAERFDREIMERFDRDSFNFMRHGPARKNVIRIALAIMALILLFFLSPFGTIIARDRKSTRLNSSHLGISYAVFCLKKKKLVDEPCGDLS